MAVKSNQKVSDEDFIRLWYEHMSAVKIAELTSLDIRNVYVRRRYIENKYKIRLVSVKSRMPEFVVRDHMSRMDVDLDNAVIFIASDAHYWPDEISTAHQAFVKLIKKHKPDIVVMNGDAFDGASISRYPKSGYETFKMPSVKEELEAVSDRLGEIEKVAGNAKLIFTMGNHDQRFEAKLANQAPEFQGVPGFSLKEHFPRWLFCMSMMINKNLMVKHRYANGLHATYNNTMKAGVSMVTGHLHRLQATIVSDYNGTRWGIDTGTLCETDGDQMAYGEDNPANHCSGFAVLTIINGRLIQPEFCAVLDGVAYFRGQPV
jgi:UDP-2,3-diacylglucosamine pyrophosphatase LpxH